MIHRLVIVSGWPGTGKTTVRSYLCNELEFIGASHDEIIEKLYGVTFDELETHPNFEEKFRKAREIANRNKLEYLSNGHDVAIEGVANDDEVRKKYLNTNGIIAHKYLIILQTNENEIMRRRIADKRRVFPPDYWSKSAQFRQSGYAYDLGCEIIVYQNNTEQDKSAIFSDLKSRFGQK